MSSTATDPQPIVDGRAGPSWVRATLRSTGRTPPPISDQTLWAGCPRYPASAPRVRAARTRPRRDRPDHPTRQRLNASRLTGGRLPFANGRRRPHGDAIDEAMRVRRASVLWPLVVVAVGATAVFAALTIAVTGSSSLALDSRAFEVADDVRAPWLDTAARVITTLGLIAIVASAVLVGAAIIIRHHDRARAGAVVVGAALVWVSVRIIKSAVDRPRPPHPLVHTSGQSYPSAHAANSVGWLAVAIALTVVIPTRVGRIAAITSGALVAVLVGLSRIYLRAHYASDVLAGEALAVAIYALATVGAVAWQSRRESAIGGAYRRRLP
jgi:membrane-associated phospholipid phosphatase